MSRNSERAVAVPSLVRPLAALAGLLAALIASTGSAEGTGDDPVALVRRAVDATSKVRCDFVQRFTPRGFGSAQAERGTVVFGRLPAMRWTYAEPEAKVFVFDGRTSWFYSEDEQQLTIHDLTDDDRAEIPVVALSDPASLADEYAVTVRGEGALTVLEFVPRDARRAILRFIVGIDASTKRIVRLEWDDREGNHTLLELHGFGPAEIRDETFRFDPPPGVDVVRN